jgi:molybdenum cofactor guanylyltransferase
VTIVGGLLAGGESRRMGRDKAGVVLDEEAGETLGARALGALRAVCDEIVILGHGRGLDASLRQGLTALPDVLDEAGHAKGPIGGLQALLRSGRGEIYVVLPVDMPRITGAHLAALLGHLGPLEADEGARAACYVHDAESPRGARLAPLPLVLRAQCRSTIEELAGRGERRLTALVGALSPATLPCPAPEILGNVNDFNDLQAQRGARPRR